MNTSIKNSENRTELNHQKLTIDESGVGNLPWIKEIKEMADSLKPFQELPFVPPYTGFPAEEWPMPALDNETMAQELVLWSLAIYYGWHIKSHIKLQAFLRTQHGDVITAIFPDDWKCENCYFIDLRVEAKTWPDLAARDQDGKFSSIFVFQHRSAHNFAAQINHTGRSIAQMLQAHEEARPVLEKYNAIKRDVKLSRQS